MIRIAVVDDQELVRAGFCALLDAEPGFEVVAEADNGHDAVQLAMRHRLDIVLMDVRMPGLDGIEATRMIRALPNPPQVLVLTTFDTDEYAFDALQAGAAGFLIKDTPPAQLVAAVTAAHDGGAVISPTTARRLVDHLVAARAASQRPAPAAIASLTDRERDVLGLIALGCSNREISARLGITELTTKTHVSRLLAKLGLDSRVQAAALAYRCGMVLPE